MKDLKIYSVCHKEFLDSSVDNLSDEERKYINCYIVNEKYDKNDENFTKKVTLLREYELPNYKNQYQECRYFEYSILPHFYLNPEIFGNLSFLGMMHSDIIFKKDSIKNLINELDKNPRQIFYYKFFNPIQWEDGGPLYLSKEEVYKICEYMSNKMRIFVNPVKIITEGWIGSMAIAPADVFTKFGKFIDENHKYFLDIINQDIWGIQSYPKKHNLVGLIERLWGFYLASINLPMQKIDIIHCQDLYAHDYEF